MIMASDPVAAAGASPRSGKASGSKRPDALAPAVAATPVEIGADAFAEGWRIGRAAARFVLAVVEAEATKPAARDVIADARWRIDALPQPDRAIALPRADRLEAAIRAALALSAAELTPEAATVLEGALK
jgi:hypothetical protein